MNSNSVPFPKSSHNLLSLVDASPFSHRNKPYAVFRRVNVIQCSKIAYPQAVEPFELSSKSLAYVRIRR